MGAYSLEKLGHPIPFMETEVNPTLSDIEVVYVDSQSALAAARCRGLNKYAEVRSSSPALNLDPSFNVVQSDAHLTPSTVQRFYDEVTDWAYDAYKVLSEDKEFSDVALLVAQRILRLQTQVFKLMALQKEDFERPVATVTIETDAPLIYAKLNAPYAPILAVNPQFTEIKIPLSSVPLAEPITPPQPSLRERLRFADWQTKAYRLIATFWNRMPVSSPFGTILIFNEGDLLKETAIHLAKRGFGLRHLRPPLLPAQPDNPNPALRTLFQPFLQTRLENWLTPLAIKGTVDFLVTDIESTVSEFQGSLSAWRSALDALSPLRPQAVLANYVAGPVATALCIAARERSLLRVAFQHGMAREIADDAKFAEFFDGNITADVLFTFNREAARIINRNSLGNGKAIPVGMQRDHYRAAQLPSNDPDAPPIWYISTMLYIGNYQMLTRGMVDLDVAKYECSMIDEVLARLPHQVLYKPYPASRYPDPDPVNEKAAACANIKLYEMAQDLRYLLANSRIVITSRPTSTLGWCLTSDRPVIYIDVPGQPMLPNAKAALAKGLFFFDGTLPLCAKPLLEFLSQPIEDIERQWVERAAARRALIEQYVDGGNKNAGAQAAQLLIKAKFTKNRLAD